jgi:heptaprenylglyceryl phosphate synthase
VEKYGTAGQATDGSIIRRRKDAICLPDTSGKKTHTRAHTHTVILVIVNSSSKYFAARQQREGKTLLQSYGNTEHFYIVDSYLYAKNNKREGTVACPWQQ